MEKERKIDLIGFCLLAMTILILGSCLFFMLNWAMAWDNQVHENKMEELELEKEIMQIKINDDLSELDNFNISLKKIPDTCEAQVLKNTLEYERIIKQIEIRDAKCQYQLYEIYNHTLN